MIEIINGERVEFRKQQFILNKLTPVTLPDKRTGEVILLEAAEFLESRGFEALAIRRVTNKGVPFNKQVPFNGVFVDVFEAYVREV